MRDIQPLIDRLAALKADLRRRYPISELGVFGSYARGEQRAGSDIDILVEFDGPVTLFDLVDIEDSMTRDLGIKVDLVPRAGLKPRIGRRVMAEVVRV